MSKMVMFNLFHDVWIASAIFCFLFHCKESLADEKSEVSRSQTDEICQHMYFNAPYTEFEAACANFVHDDSFDIRSSSYAQYQSKVDIDVNPKFRSQFSTDLPLYINKDGRPILRSTIRLTMKILRIMNLLRKTGPIDSSSTMRKNHRMTPLSLFSYHTAPQQRSLDQNQNQNPATARRRRNHHDGKHPMYLF